MTQSGIALREAEHAVDGAKQNYLRAFGWVPTCETPGSYWLWRRDFTDIHKKYGVVAVPTDLAVAMTLAVLDDEDDEG